MASVLIVDDDPDLLEVTQELLKAAGHEVRVGRSGQQGLRCLSQATLPDCVLLDVEMPVLNGPQMAHEMLRHDAGEEKIPIVLVSGRKDLPEVAARMGTPYFLAKGSANYAELVVELVGRALGERRAPSSA